MTIRRILTLMCTALLFAEARQHTVNKRDTSSLCDPDYNSTNKIQCYCARDTKDRNLVKSADCYLTEGVVPDDQAWAQFDELKDISKLTLTNNKGISLKFIPTTIFTYTTKILKLDIKYGNIETVQPFAFANLSTLDEITLRGSQLQVLKANAFAHHRDLTSIILDQNNIEEINRNVFVNLPSLEKLFLTSNKITTIHDRAFVHLTNLRELEINMNSVFSLNSETFSGLEKLQKLDLSSNSLEVIGDNTFLPLGNLKLLNLESNKIQMLDAKAFRGLGQLKSLSLAHNKLPKIENIKVFEGLSELTSLSLRANEIGELKREVMAPILSNFYDVTGNLDVEDNNFACDCHLDWFMSLMNTTQNKKLKITLENFKCVPDSKLRDTWSKLQENDKNENQGVEEDPQQVSDYEYYDDSQLNGKLFYIDVRDLINCPGVFRVTPTMKPEEVPTTVKLEPRATTKVTSNPSHTHTTIADKPMIVTTKLISNSKVTNHGLLDLSMYETTPTTKDNEATTKVETTNNGSTEKKPIYTTSRLATVSAKPIENRNMYEDMASDEAKPDKLKAHRSVQEEYDDSPTVKENNAHRNLGYVFLIATLGVWLLY